jgi:hypothetical protein
MKRLFPVRAKNGPPKIAVCGAMTATMKSVFFKSSNGYVPFSNYFYKRNDSNFAILNFPVRAL